MIHRSSHTFRFFLLLAVSSAEYRTFNNQDQTHFTSLNFVKVGLTQLIKEREQQFFLFKEVLSGDMILFI